jgi:Ribonuclease G/E
MSEKFVIEFLKAAYGSIGPRQLLLLIAKTIAEKSVEEKDKLEADFLMRIAETVLHQASVLTPQA